MYTLQITIKRRDLLMTKAELVEKMAKDADISKAAAGKALDSMIDGVKKTLKKGNKVSLVGFGTFSISKRKARTGRNPQTGATIKIAARKVPKFSAGKAFKDAVK
jgi:DNA-binding protein HU-beta